MGARTKVLPTYTHRKRRTTGVQHTHALLSDAVRWLIALRGCPVSQDNDQMSARTHHAQTSTCTRARARANLRATTPYRTWDRTMVRQHRARGLRQTEWRTGRRRGSGLAGCFAEKYMYVRDGWSVWLVGKWKRNSSHLRGVRIHLFCVQSYTSARAHNFIHKQTSWHTKNRGEKFEQHYVITPQQQ